MGTGSAILRKKDRLNELELYRAKTILEDIFNKYDYYYEIIYHERRGKKYYDIGIGDYDRSEEGLVMYCYGYPDNEIDDEIRTHRFDLIDNDLDIFLEIESISHGPIMTLRILYDYFKFFPNDYFYTDDNIFFTKKDIEKVYNSSKWEGWYYSKPD